MPYKYRPRPETPWATPVVTDVGREPAVVRIEVERALADGSKADLGVVIRSTDHRGRTTYRFHPRVSGRRSSRKDWDSMAECLPDWVGYPDACQTRVTYQWTPSASGGECHDRRG